MNERSATTEVDLTADVAGDEVAHVGALVDHDPLVLTQSPGQLAVADVDRGHPQRASPQQDVGEATRRSARIEAAAALDDQSVRAEGRERADQLVRSAGDVVVAVGDRLHVERVGAVDLGGRFGRALPGHRDPARVDQLNGMIA